MKCNNPLVFLNVVCIVQSVYKSAYQTAVGFTPAESSGKFVYQKYTCTVEAPRCPQQQATE